jgi:hypothetical protein
MSLDQPSPSQIPMPGSSPPRGCISKIEAEHGCGGFVPPCPPRLTRGRTRHENQRDTRSHRAIVQSCCRSAPRRVRQRKRDRLHSHFREEPDLLKWLTRPFRQAVFQEMGLKLQTMQCGRAWCFDGFPAAGLRPRSKTIARAARRISLCHIIWRKRLADQASPKLDGTAATGVSYAKY